MLFCRDYKTESVGYCFKFCDAGIVNFTIYTDLQVSKRSDQQFFTNTISNVPFNAPEIDVRSFHIKRQFVQQIQTGDVVDNIDAQVSVLNGGQRITLNTAATELSVRHIC